MEGFQVRAFREFLGGVKGLQLGVCVCVCVCALLSYHGDDKGPVWRGALWVALCRIGVNGPISPPSAPGISGFCCLSQTVRAADSVLRSFSPPDIGSTSYEAPSSSQNSSLRIAALLH